METIAHWTALCRPEALGGIGMRAWLFVAGLAGSLVHCMGMCGPFVLGQVMADVERGPRAYGEWHRLAGAALAPMSHWIVGIFTGLLGLMMAAAARDFGVLAFGLGLALFVTLFCWWMIRTACDEIEQADRPSRQE